MKQLEEHLTDAVDRGASDILIISGSPISYKIGAEIIRTETEVIMPERGDAIVTKLFELAHRDMTKFLKTGDDDFPLSMFGLSRFRVNAYMQRGSMAAVVRIVTFDIPNAKDMHIPDKVMDMVNIPHGLALVTGPSGAGKTTTLACVINEINTQKSAHIITLEDPAEYLHKNIKGTISQREIGSDTNNYVSAMRAALRQTPDVILLGEMRDAETISAAVTAAETGHLVLSTLHTVGAVNTVDRIIDSFPPNQHHQIRVQLSQILQIVVSQQLLPTKDGGSTAVFEVMRLNNAIRNLVREAKTHQIESFIQSSGAEGMISMDAAILEAYCEGRITEETALKYALHPDQLAKKLQLIKR
ncbi:PilT/PilU family type 4a pilus ATPase [Clostridiaceae bacterium OttesenSCG-928-D20]|nr:PilT/PilU family type 4a pilus ATPase [Clostridiaceae bacterium OttesenSCG-928-D20]